MNAPALPPSDPASERIPVPEGDDSGQQGSDTRRAAERAALVALITARDYFPLWSVPCRSHAEDIADRLLAAGWRRVTEDPAAALEALGKIRAYVEYMEPEYAALAAGGKDPIATGAWMVLVDVQKRLPAVLRGGEQP